MEALSGCIPGIPVTLGLCGQPFGERGLLIAGLTDEVHGAAPRHSKAPGSLSPRSFIGYSQNLPDPCTHIQGK